MQLGRAYMAAKNFDAARVQFIRAYQQGNAQAAANLAYLYEKGQGVPRDDAEAVRLSKIAADQGNAQGQNGQRIRSLRAELNLEHDYEVVPGVAHNPPLFYKTLGERSMVNYQKALMSKPVAAW